MLSNNRGALATLDLVFTVFGRRPTPFYMLSRISTPLSSTGITHFADLVRRLTSSLRFVFVDRGGLAVRVTSRLGNVAVPGTNVSALIDISLSRTIHCMRDWSWADWR